MRSAESAAHDFQVKEGMSDSEMLEIALDYIGNQKSSEAWESHLEESRPTNGKWGLFNEDTIPIIQRVDDESPDEYEDADAMADFVQDLQKGKPAAVEAAGKILKYQRREQSRGSVGLELFPLAQAMGWSNKTQLDLLVEFLGGSILNDECIEFLQKQAETERNLTPLEAGDEVDVPEPVTSFEEWKHSFTGTVVRVWTTPQSNVDMVTVRDQEECEFDVEASRVERTD